MTPPQCSGGGISHVTCTPSVCGSNELRLGPNMACSAAREQHPNDPVAIRHPAGGRPAPRSAPHTRTRPDLTRSHGPAHPAHLAGTLAPENTPLFEHGARRPAPRASVRPSRTPPAPRVNRPPRAHRRPAAPGPRRPASGGAAVPPLHATGCRASGPLRRPPGPSAAGPSATPPPQERALRNATALDRPATDPRPSGPGAAASRPRAPGHRGSGPPNGHPARTRRPTGVPPHAAPGRAAPPVR